MIDAGKQPYAAWQERIEDKLNNIQVQVARLGETQTTTAEVDAKVATRVATETYASDTRGINERLARLEASPMRMLGWLGAATGCLGLLMSFSLLVFGVITWVILHYK